MPHIATRRQAIAALKGADTLSQLWSIARLVFETLDVHIDITVTVPGFGRFHVHIDSYSFSVDRVA